MMWGRSTGGLRDVVYFFLEDEKEVDKFAEWAFGPGYEAIDTIDLALRWNELHGDLHEIKRENKIYEDVAKMIKLWREDIIIENRESDY